MNSRGVVRPQSKSDKEDHGKSATPAIESSADGGMLLRVPRQASPSRSQEAPRRSKRPHSVVEEDDYNRDLTSIIMRDYFGGSESILPNLDKYQANTTSEDNESFNKLLDKQVALNRLKYSWLWDGTNRIEGSQAKTVRALEASKQRLMLTDGTYAEHEAANGRAGAADVRPPAVLDSWKQRGDDESDAGVTDSPLNSLMFYPEPVPDRSSQQAAEILSVSRPSSNLPTDRRIIIRENTQITPAVIEANRPVSRAPSRNASKSDVQTINSYGFITENTLDLSRNPSPKPFEMPEPSKRDELHRALVDKTVARRKEDQLRASQGSLAFSPQSALATPSKRATLSPAASRLIQRMSGTSAGRSSFDIRTPKTPKSSRRKGS